MDTASDAPVTSIASDPGSSQIFVAGFGDGWIKVFDRRFEEDEAIVQTYRGHNAWVQNVKPHPTMIYQFLSARCVLCVQIVTEHRLLLQRGG